MAERRVGIRSIISIPDSPEEIRSDELEEFYKKDIEGKKYTPQLPPEIDTLDLPSINITPLKSSKETKDIHGNNQSEKDRAINSYLNRPPDNIKKMVEKSMPITTYIDKMNTLYGGQEKRKIDDKGYPYTYKSKLDTLVEKSEQHSAEKFHEEQINDIQKRGKSWLVKHLNKQDQETDQQKIAEDRKREVKRLQGIVERDAKARRVTDQYGNEETATDRIQDQARKKESEMSKTNKPRRFR